MPSKSKSSRQALTNECLRRFLTYDRTTGKFFWLDRPSNRVSIGEPAGNNHRGYVRIRIKGQLFPAHELAWFFEHGEWPRFEIDHVNGNGSDNRIENLRDVPHSINGQNQRRARIDNKLGKLGVIRYQDGFAAKIMLHGKTHYLGKHKTPEDAHRAYVRAKRQLHEGCTL